MAKSRSQEKIPFSIPFVPKDAIELIEKALDSEIQQGNGEFAELAVSEIQSHYSDRQVFLTPSCTAALEMSLMLNDVGPDDEVIVPSFTFTSAATAVTKLFATPVFCDIDLQNGCLDVEMLERLVTPKTKVITWVNYAGLAPNLQYIKDLSKERGIALVEDASHNFGELTINQKELTGDCVVFSFHASKNLQCGEGGALLVRDDELVRKARIIQEKGTNRHEFSMGKVDKYKWVGKGGSYLLAEINSALLVSQLQSFKNIQKERKELVSRYMKIAPILEEVDWQVMKGVEKAAHLFALVAPNELVRNEFIRQLNEESVTTVSHYEDLSSSPAGQVYGKKTNLMMRNSIDLSKRIVRLPLYVGLGDRQEIVIEAVRRFLTQ
jgi:dTDP-4-amino-4,6-dideoxygalactose transaminase